VGGRPGRLEGGESEGSKEELSEVGGMCGWQIRSGFAGGIIGLVDEGPLGVHGGRKEEESIQSELNVKQ